MTIVLEIESQRVYSRVYLEYSCIMSVEVTEIICYRIYKSLLKFEMRYKMWGLNKHSFFQFSFIDVCKIKLEMHHFLFPIMWGAVCVGDKHNKFTDYIKMGQLLMVRGKSH